MLKPLGLGAPLEIVTSFVSRWLAGPHSPRGDFNTSEDWRAEIRRAADDLFAVDGTACRALGEQWTSARDRLAARLLLGAAANARWR